MKKLKKYTFENWWKGEIVLMYAVRVHKKDENLKVVTWDDFKSEERAKIEQKQKELFEQAVSNLFARKKAEFTKQFADSKAKEILLKHEIKQCYDILFEQIPFAGIILATHWDMSFDYNDLRSIQRFVKQKFILGKDEGYAFMHSPDCKYRHNNKHSVEVYACYLWKYYNWLLESNLNQDENPNVTYKYPKELERAVKCKWFVIAIAFANGEMDKLLEAYKVDGTPNYSAISRKIGMPKSRSWISESLSVRKSDKNIFANHKKIEIIEEYFRIHNIQICDSFYQRIAKLKKQGSKK
ncbi:MAG: hypothetical protein KJZ56_09565 [Flavobacteriales bacterium]|nr:hypothetical protein [Flavobacteriales bacterium]